MAEAKSGAERRRVPRVSVDFPVTLTWRRKEHRLQAREFSEYGILVASDQKDLIGEEVQVGLALNAGESPISLDGTVVYGTDAAIGIRFKNVPSEDQQTLRAYAMAHGIGINRSQS
jgi:hypothetical protein